MKSKIAWILPSAAAFSVALAAGIPAGLHFYESKKKIEPLTSSQILEIEESAKTWIHTIGRAQQAYYIEKEILTQNFDDLGLSLPYGSLPYSLAMTTSFSGRATYYTMTPEHPALLGFLGVVAAVEETNVRGVTTSMIMCSISSDAPKQVPDNPERDSRGNLICPVNSRSI